MNKTTRWLFTVPGGKKLYILILTIAQGVVGASSVFYALFLRNIVDAAVARSPRDFWYWVAAIILLVLAQRIVRTFIRWLSMLARSTFENIFKQRLTSMILRKDFLSVSAVHSGEWLNRLTNDTGVVANTYVDLLPGLTEMVVKLCSAFVMIVALEPRISYVIIPCGVLIVAFSIVFRKRLKQFHKDIQESDGRLRVFLQERFGNLLMIHSFAAEDQTEQKAVEKMDEHKAARMRSIHFSNLCNFFFAGAVNAMYLLGVIWCGYGILQGVISFGTLTAITQLIAQIQAPFANISGFLPKFYAMTASAERLMEAESFADDRAELLTGEECQRFYHGKLAAIGLRNASFTYFPPVERSDELNDLSKEAMPIVLEKLSLQIRKGEYVAFTGHSGCGKSTALKLLMCVYRPDAGERYYKEENGTEGKLSSAYRRLFSYVPQGNALLSGTIREIVSFAEPSAAHDDERIERALRIACAEEFVSELENGVDTLLGERGAGLSEGQMQRVAIARAIFSDSPILLLDEATSSLDADTERALLENLRRMTDKTVVIVTHRSAALDICDRVLRFTEGKVTEL